MYHTKSKFKRQAPNHLKTQLDASFIWFPQESFRQKLTPIQFKVFEHLLWYASKYNRIFPSQSVIAEAIGCRRETVCDAIARLVHYGLIVKTQRLKTWCYAISAWFKSEKVRRRLAFLFPILAIGLPAITNLSIDQLVSQGNVTVTLKNNKDLRFTRFKKLSCSSLFNTELYCTDKRERTTSVKNVSKKGYVMSDNSPVSAIVKKITPQLNLTKWGQIRLSAFPDEILNIASDNLSNSKKKIDNRFAWFFSTCIALCSERKVAPDWDKIDRLKKEYGQPFDAHMTLPGDHPEFVNKITKDHRTRPALGTKPYSGHIPEEVLRQIQNHKEKYGDKPRPTFTEQEKRQFFTSGKAAQHLKSDPYLVDLARKNYPEWKKDPNQADKVAFLEKTLGKDFFIDEKNDSIWKKAGIF